MVVEAIHTCKARRNFEVVSVNSQTNSVAKFNHRSTAIIITDVNSTITDLNAQDRGDLVVTGVPGMSKQINTLNEFLLLITQPCNVKGDKMSAAFVIHGGSGTGKTFILKRIAATKWGRVHWIKPSDKIASIRETFKLAQSQQPSIVLMDNFESLISKDRSNRDTVIETIGEELDALAEISQSKNAYTQVVVIATCSDFYTDIPEELRSSTRFLEHTPLPIPRTHERQEILEYLDPPIKGDKQALLLELAQMTHAYSPKDLSILIQTAVRGRKTQLLKAGVDPGEERFLEKSDLERARKAVRPTAMRDINLNPPTIHWQDVGGQDVLKKALNRMIKYTKVRYGNCPSKSTHKILTVI
jgi:AAA family ATPase